MNSRLLSTVLIAAGLAVMVVLWVHSSHQSQTGMMEAPQKTLAEIPHLLDLGFTPPELPEVLSVWSKTVSRDFPYLDIIECWAELGIRKIV